MSLTEYISARGGDGNSSPDRANANPDKDTVKASALADLGIDDSECSELSKKHGSDTPICSFKTIGKAISTFVAGSSNGAKSGSNILEQAKEITKCDTEKCVLMKPEVIKVLGEEGITKSDINKNINVNFKGEGPRNIVNRLHNENIDGVLREWAAANKDFYNWGFNMIDFEKYKGTLARYSMVDVLDGDAPLDLGKFGGVVKRPCKFAACVLNTDSHNGKGKHWFAVVCDCREEPYSIEFFNSSGNAPVTEVIDWMEKTKAALSKKFPNVKIEEYTNTGKRHQFKDTECGLYSLYFIRRRLDVHPFSDFLTNKYWDKIMTEFRKFCFHSR